MPLQWKVVTTRLSTGNQTLCDQKYLLGPIQGEGHNCRVYHDRQTLALAKRRSVHVGAVPDVDRRDALPHHFTYARQGPRW